MRALITGGAGFIGTNLVLRLSKLGWKVIILDNLSRLGTKNNLETIREGVRKGSIETIVKDIRQNGIFDKIVDVDAIFHLAAQTAVTTSIINPNEDLEINILGTLNLLESVRKKKSRAIVIYSSTNKVYGPLNYLKYKNLSKRHELSSFPRGINERISLDFYSPYGCSKGAAESYVRDYSRIYNIDSVVFRQSCIYGIHQLGIEDQGWVAHMAAKVILGETINVYGDGKQVRDILYVDDLINLYLKAVESPREIKGKAFNVGGGVDNSISVLEYIDFLSSYFGRKVAIVKNKIRPGDQKVFISDNSLVKRVLDWEPKVGYKIGLPKMISWIEENKKIFENF